MGDINAMFVKPEDIEEVIVARKPYSVRLRRGGKLFVLE